MTEQEILAAYPAALEVAKSQKPFDRLDPEAWIFYKGLNLFTFTFRTYHNEHEHIWYHVPVMLLQSGGWYAGKTSIEYCGWRKPL